MKNLNECTEKQNVYDEEVFYLLDPKLHRWWLL